MAFENYEWYLHMYDIIILSGVSGAGKSFLIQKAMQEYEWLCQIPSITTRDPRKGIDESGSRIFLSESEFDDEMKDGNLVFYNVVFEKRYAYRYSDILNSIRQGKIALLDMKISAVYQVKKMFPKTLCVYIKIPKQNVETEIGFDRNNLKLRVEDALSEQQGIEENDILTKEIDILFQNNIDRESVDRFLKLLVKLRCLK